MFLFGFVLGVLATMLSLLVTLLVAGRIAENKHVS